MVRPLYGGKCPICGGEIWEVRRGNKTGRGQNVIGLGTHVGWMCNKCGSTNPPGLLLTAKEKEMVANLVAVMPKRVPILIPK